MLFRKKETQKLLEARTRALKYAEAKVESRNKSIKEFQEEAEVLIETNADLRSENEDLQYFKRRVIDIMNTKGTIVDKYDKIIELVHNLTTEN